MKKRGIKQQALFELGVFTAIIIIVNIISFFLFTRFDFTREKRFTLTKASKELVRDLDDIVYIKIYLEGDFPAGFKRLRNSTAEILDEFRAYSKGNLEYEFINPSADPDQRVKNEVYNQLIKLGLSPINLQVKDDKGSSQQIIFPGGIITYRNSTIPFQLLLDQIGMNSDQVLNNSIQNLEYQIASNIRKAIQIEKPLIAFVEGHGELDTLATGDIIHTLKEFYNVEPLYLPSTAPEDLNKYAAIVIAKPRIKFLEGEKFNIDQYIMNGGKVLWFVENVEATLDSLQDGTTLTSNYELNLDDQLFTYGARVNYDLIQDMQCAPIPIVTGNVGGRPQQQLLPWLYYPLMIPVSRHPVVRNLDAIRSEFANTIDSVDVQGIRKTVLLSSSKYTKVLNSPVRISLSLLNIEPNPEQFNKPFRPVAMLLEGEFNSVFRNRITVKQAGAKFIEKSKPTKMIVVSDGDIIKNFVGQDSTIYPLGYDRFTQQTFGNRNFVLNAIDYLVDDTGIMSARAKEVKLRLLDKGRIKTERLKWQLINTVIPVILVILFGLVQHYLRKRKFAK